MVADDAVKRAKGAERLRAILFGVATIIFVGICLFSYQQVGEITPQNLRENVGFAVIQFAAESFLLIVVVFIAIGAFIFNVPPELHNTKLTEINALKDKYERPPLPFFLEITEEKEPIDRPRVGIRIYNPRPNAIEHLVVRLVELRLLKNDEKWESISLVGNLGLPKVMYTHGEGDIRGFDHAIVYIAKAGEEEITFLTGDEFYRAYWTNENARTNQFLTKELPLGVKDTTLNLKKMRLYKECGGLCVYTGDRFTKEQIFNGEINLEHIVPYSIIPNNSIKNLALCYVDENLKKGNKTPFEFYSSNISKWKEVKARAKQVFNSDKYLHFISESKPDFQDFANRQLNDTRHIMTEVKDYLFENICSNIMVTTGEVTSKIRTSWGLNEILGTTDSKNTLDNRNHAVDAIVIAYTSLSIQRKILDLKRNKISIFDNIPTPYDLKQLQRDVTNIICNIITKHQEKKRFKSSGTIRRNLHDSNPFGKLSNGSFVKRKAISSFDTHGSIKKIVDLQVRKSIETHLLTYANEILANDNKIKGFSISIFLWLILFPEQRNIS
jgi:hypothetical protein